MPSPEQYEEPVCLTAAVVCARSSAAKLVLRAATCGSRVRRSTAVRRLESAACEDPAAQRCSPSSPFIRMPVSPPAVVRARPNPSLNHRTPNGGLSWPGLAVRGTFSPARAKPSRRRGPVSSNVRPQSQMHIRRVLPFALTLLLGFIAGGYVFSKTVERSFLAVHNCEDSCLELKDFAGLLGSVGIQYTPNLLPYLVAQSRECVAVRHPKPEWRFHLVFLPKRDVRNVLELTPSDLPYLTACLALAQEQVSRAGVKNYRLVTNGPELQHVTYFHFHVIAK